MRRASDAECRAMLATISAYLDGDLEVAECTAIERHCRDCPECAALVEGLRNTIGLCREAGAAPLPEAVRQRARAGIRRLLDTERRSHRP
jgi:anti-sigma factor RsiW